MLQEQQFARTNRKRDRQADSQRCIAFDYAGYLELVDWSGRCCRQDKRGAIGAAIPPILERLNIAPDAWMVAMRPSGFPLNRALGRQDRMSRYASNNGCCCIQGKVPAVYFFTKNRALLAIDRMCFSDYIS